MKNVFLVILTLLTIAMGVMGMNCADKDEKKPKWPYYSMMGAAVAVLALAMFMGRKSKPAAGGMKQFDVVANAKMNAPNVGAPSV